MDLQNQTKFRGTIDWLKDRLVAKGNNQVIGIDYFDCFSPVAKLLLFVFFCIAASKSYPIHQFDINNAILHGHLNEEVYMSPPEGYSKAKNCEVYKLNISLCGLKQASRQ